MNRLVIINLITICSISITNSAHVHSMENVATHCKKTNSTQRCAKTMTSVFDKNRRLWSTWSDGNFIYVNFSDNKGKTFSKAVKINSTPEKIAARHEHRPKIKVSMDGRIYLSWTKKLEKRFTGDIRFSKSENNGASFSPPVTVNDNHEIISHRFDTLGVNKKGDIYISWLDKRDKHNAIKTGKKYNGAAVYYAFSNDFGNSFSKNIKIVDNSCECCRMAMDFDRSDLPVIAWRQIYNSDIRDHSIVNFTSKTVHNTPLRLSVDNWKISGCPHHGPSLKVDNDNTYHSVWFTNASKQHGIFYANSHNEGKNFSTPLQIGNYANKASHADISSLNNSVFITWQEYESPTYKLYLMKSKNKGQDWSAPELITTSVKKPDYPFLITDSQNIYVSWHVPGETYQLIPIEK